MIISTLEELRLFSPSNAIDNIDSLTGFVNSSEHDFLKEKLGAALYKALVAYYNETIRGGIDEYVAQMQNGTDVPAYAQLLYLAQKAVTFDALARAINVQAISVNGAGVNVASADDYKAADAQSIADFKKACVKESHSAVNEMLQCLEQWAVELSDVEVDDSDLAEQKEIVGLWQKSRYYYLVSSLLIPCASVLQEYYNIYDSREKFIQMLPDLRYIQEDILAPIYSDDFIEYFAQWPFMKHEHEPSKYLTHILHYLRKIMARYLETRLLKPSDARFETARNEAVKLTARLNEYIQVHQESFDDHLVELIKTTPLYVDTETEETSEPLFKNNADGSVIFVTPGLI